MTRLIDQWRALNKRLKSMLDEYGQPALWSYVVLALTWFVASYIAIETGFAGEGMAVSAGKLGAAYAFYKITMPARILVALVLVPVSARMIRRLQRSRESQA